MNRTKILLFSLLAGGTVLAAGFLLTLVDSGSSQRPVDTGSAYRPVDPGPAPQALRATTGLDPAVLRRSVDEAVERSRRLAERARGFSQDVALAALGESQVNGFSFRFDDNLDLAQSHSPTGQAEVLSPSLDGIEFAFDDAGKPGLSPEIGSGSIEGGILSLEYEKGDYLRSDEAMEVDPTQLAIVEVRMKSTRGAFMTLGWTTKFGSKMMSGENIRNFSKNVGGMKVETVSDGEFHTYRIEVTNALHRRVKRDDKIEQFYLMPSNSPGDRIEIDFVRLLFRKAKYTLAPATIFYETVKDDMRQALCVQAPLSLNYDIELPTGQKTFAVGMAALASGGGVRFTVDVTGSGKTQRLVDETVYEGEAWRDAKIDLPAWAVGTVKVELKVEGEPGDIGFWSAPWISSPPKTKFNVLIVLEDALRADRLSSYGNPRETTPVKDRLFSEGVRFQNAFSQATKTRPSCPSLMTSLYPTSTGVWSTTEMLHDNYLTLAEIMRSQGFRTTGFIQNLNAGPAAGLHQGYDQLILRGRVGTRGNEIYAEAVTSWLERHKDENFFLYIHGLDPHGPYEPRKAYRGWWDENEENPQYVIRDKTMDPRWVESPTLAGRLNLYDGEIAENDFYFERLVRKLRDLDILDHTLVVFISDHGEYLGEHGMWKHRAPSYRQGINVPMMMRLPGTFPAGGVVDQPVQLIDVMPTVLELAGISLESLLLSGDSLLPLVRGENLENWNRRLVISEETYNKSKSDPEAWGSLIVGDWHLLRSHSFKWKNEWYEDGKGDGEIGLKQFNYRIDPEEKWALGGGYADEKTQARVAQYLEALQAEHRKVWLALTRGGTELIHYQPETLEQLRDLGYL